MIKKNLSGILISLGAILVCLFFPVDLYSSLSYLLLTVGIALMLIGIRIQRKIKRKVIEKDLIDSLPE